MTEQKKTVVHLKLTDEQREGLKVTKTWVLEVDLDRSDYSLTEVSKICDISPAWLRICLKEGRIHAFKNERGHWRVKRSEVVRLWHNQVEKYLDRGKTVKEGKKYTYRRPSEWATHLFRKFVKNTTNLTAAQKKTVRMAIDKAEVQWEREYAERVAKKAAKEAEEAKKAKK